MLFKKLSTVSDATMDVEGMAGGGSSNLTADTVRWFLTLRESWTTFFLAISSSRRRRSMSSKSEEGVPWFSGRLGPVS